MLKKLVLCSVCFFLVRASESTSLCAKMIYVEPFTLVLENKTTTSANIYCNKVQTSSSINKNPIRKNLLSVLNSKKNELSKCCNYFTSGRELYCNDKSCVVSNKYENRKSMQLSYMKNKTFNMVKDRLFMLVDNPDTIVKLVCIKEAFKFQNNSYVKTYTPCVTKSCFICSQIKIVKNDSLINLSEAIKLNTPVKKSKIINSTFAKNKNITKTVKNSSNVNISFIGNFNTSTKKNYKNNTTFAKIQNTNKAIRNDSYIDKSTKENNINKTKFAKNKFTTKDKWKLVKMLLPFLLMCLFSCLIITAMVWYRSASLKVNNMVKKFLVLVPSDISRNDRNSIHLYENQSMLIKPNTQTKETKFDKQKKAIYKNQELKGDIGKSKKKYKTIIKKKQRSEIENFSSEEPVYHEILDLKADDATTKKFKDFQIINKTEQSLTSSNQGK